ncbi:unnamed protein product, partial [Durusdinium trenchii]
SPLRLKHPVSSKTAVAVMMATGLLSSTLGSLTPPCKPDEHFDLDEPVPDFPEDEGAKSYMSGELVDGKQTELKTPRQSYLVWHFPDELPDDVAIPPNRLLHEIKKKQFSQFVESICATPRKFQKEEEDEKNTLLPLLQ